MASKSSDKREEDDSAATESNESAWGAGMPTHNIWLAGLGALAQAQADAQAEGRKAFEALVSQGVEMQTQSQEMATRQWAEAAERLGAMTQQVAGGAPTWNRLGSIFESRVQRALNTLGLPTAEQWAELNARVEQLEQALAAHDGAAGSDPKSKGRATAAAKKNPRSSKS